MDNTDSILVPRSTLEDLLQRATAVSDALKELLNPKAIAPSTNPPVMLDIPFWKILDKVLERHKDCRMQDTPQSCPDQTPYPIPGKKATAHIRAFMVRCLDQGYCGKASVEDLLNAVTVITLYWVPPTIGVVHSVQAAVRASLEKACEERLRGPGEEPNRVERPNYAIFAVDKKGIVSLTFHGRKMAKHFREDPRAMRCHLTAIVPVEDLPPSGGVRRLLKGTITQKELSGKNSDY